MRGASRTDRGFTILELMVAMAIFLVICAAMFGLLQLSQQKYSSETQMSGSFQEARLGIDQIVRDINISGYPSFSLFSNPASTASYAVSPFAWDPGYLNTPFPAPCHFGINNCNPTPSDFDLIVETDFGNGTGVNWIRYQLIGSILYRGVVQKTPGTDPVAATSVSGVMTPFVENVMNTASGALLAQITAQYPKMFPNGPVPLFQYTCSTPTGPQLCSSGAAAGYDAPKNISDIDVTLIVKTPQVDMQTNSLKLMELTGRGHRSNPAN
jgi:prepilin-type N-terminal cleavage/methylation domain-containing protein